jgi:cobalt/nickel transport system permease protein
MHLPDGLLSTPVWIATDGVSLAAIGYSLKRVNRRLDPVKVPLMAVMAAFVFAAQMINVPIPGLPKVSGHPLGGLLAAVLLGPLEATLIMTVVFVVQALLFQDGGIAVMGANILNMGLAATLGAYAVYVCLRRLSAAPLVQSGALFVAAWFSVFLGATLTAAELWLSGTVPLPSGVLFGAMLMIHALIGVAEGVVTVAAVRVIAGNRPDLLPQFAPPPLAKEETQ